jgi:hypothetical protein
MGKDPLDKVLTQGHVVEATLFLQGQQGEAFGTTSRGNMPVPFLYAIPLLFYIFTRQKHEFGESFL